MCERASACLKDPWLKPRHVKKDDGMHTAHLWVVGVMECIRWVRRHSL